MGRIELALGTALEWETIEVKAVKIDLLGVIAGGYVKHFTFIKLNCIWVFSYSYLISTPQLKEIIFLSFRIAVGVSV